jgi:hypothetical protein
MNFLHSLSHFPLFLLFAFLAAGVLGVLSRSTPLTRLRAATWSFLLFVAVGIAAAWLIYPFSH